MVEINLEEKVAMMSSEEAMTGVTYLEEEGEEEGLDSHTGVEAEKEDQFLAHLKYVAILLMPSKSLSFF